jgi:RNA-directed DNA polymerase
VHPTKMGTPQGGVISPLLANIILNFLDWKLAEAGYRFVRYADDFVIVFKTKKQAREALTLVLSVLDELGLQVSPEKTKITTWERATPSSGSIFRLTQGKCETSR